MLTPDLLLDFAERLAVEPGEIELRVAIGRAYYAVAHEATAIAAAAGVFRDRDVNLHRSIRQLAALPGRHGWAAIALEVERLKMFREDADYAVHYPGDLADDAAECVARAREVVGRMRGTPLPSGGR